MPSDAKTAGAAFTPQAIAYAVAAVGILAGAAGGYVRVTTPAAAECEVALAVATTRLEACAPAVERCEAALDSITGSGDAP